MVTSEGSFDQSVAVAYRHISLPQPQAPPVSGFALWYNSPEGAESFAAALKGYYEQAPSHSLVLIKLVEAQVGEYAITINIPIQGHTWNTHIVGIPAAHIDSLIRSLYDYGQIFVITGFTAADGREQIVPNCIYSTSRIQVGDRLIIGRRRLPYSWESLPRILFR